MTLLALLTDRPQNKRHLAARLYGCECLGATCVHKRLIEVEARRLVVEEHELIVANGAGYWLTESDDDLDRYEAWLEGKRDRLTERLQAIRTARKARRIADVTQETLWAA